MKKVIANMTSREKRFAVIENGRMIRLEVVPPNQASAVGNIYLGQVSKVLPGMEAVFIDFGESKNGFLHRDLLPSFQEAKRSGQKSGSISQYVREGEKILVQVTRDESGTKGARLTGLIELSSDHLVYIYGNDYVGVSKKFKSAKAQVYWRDLAISHKQPDEGLIVRTSMEEQNEEAFLGQLEAFRMEMASLQRKAAATKSPRLIKQRNTFLESLIAETDSSEEGEMVLDDFDSYQELKKWMTTNRIGWSLTYHSGAANLFSIEGLGNEAENALKKIVWLKNGGYLIFEETEAFTVVDVNTGKFTGKTEKEKTIFDTNIMAAKEISHQIRLRNIGGIILVDFINMEEEQHRKMIVDVMKTEARKDEMRVQVIGFTELGILQLTRKRTAPSLSEKMTVTCSVCNGTGKVDSPETIAFRLERELMEHRTQDAEAVWIELNEAVATVLCGENKAYLPTLEEKIGKKIFFTILPGHHNTYAIKRFGSEREFKQS